MNSIFISYRRDDSATICGRIFDSLERYLGSGNVFKDVDSIPFGVSFPQYINAVLQNSTVTLVIIGKQWLNVSGPGGGRRLDDSNDFVRVEIEAALQRRNMLTIPVLVEGATMPDPASLPERLRPLVELKSAQIRNDPDYQGDMRRLQTVLQTILLTRSQAQAATTQTRGRWSMPSVDAV